MISEPLQPGRYLVPATRKADGRILPLPVIVEIGTEGRVESWRPLEAHEPHSTRVLQGAVFDAQAGQIL